MSETIKWILSILLLPFLPLIILYELFTSKTEFYIPFPEFPEEDPEDFLPDSESADQNQQANEDDVQ